ncbi:AAA family ATPase [Alteromonas oceanisediminis]|uniref:AAA family ATPase n=1 Tax=Alteromonas oceanisediminis TaxID=2836180 RepID=UPI001BDA804A|nr:MoxR family ATPase [Alteromonas oceanisediminis]MBT0586635.1 MoxR family ATPase [Alteromonas oceanisediminis]
MTKTLDLNDEELDQLLSKLHRVTDEVGQVIVGQRVVMEQLLVSMLAGGHCLLQGVPGLAKTLMVSSLAQAVDLTFKRVQFTPDLMPSDIIGTEVLETDHDSGERFFKFQKGPVFTQILLADEINRTPPKTQAALLEAMQERQVSYAGELYPLPAPFFVLATQNPIEQSGTYPLPEAQLDRFLMFVEVSYPTEAEELEIVRRTTGSHTVSLSAQLSAVELRQLQTVVRDVEVSEPLLSYATRLTRQTRPQESTVDAITQYVKWGAGPRCAQALVLCAKAHALLHKRFAVTLDDITAVAPAVLRHRLMLNFQAEAQQVSIIEVIENVLNEVAKPSSPLLS